MSRKERRKKMNNSGETMVEMLVSFAVLAIVMLALGGMIYYSSVLRMRATDTAGICSSFYQEIYKTTPDPDAVYTYYYMGAHASDNTSMFKLVLSDETKDENLGTEKDKFRNYLKIPNIDAVGFRSRDPLIAEENLVTPRAVLFSYNGTVKKNSNSGNN